MKTVQLATLLAFAVAIGCGSNDHERDLKLHEDASADTPADAEEERIRELMKITVETRYPLNDGSGGMSPPYESRVDGQALLGELLQGCSYACADVTANTWMQETVLRGNICQLEAERCVAERLLELGKNEDASVPFDVYASSVFVKKLTVLPRSRTATVGILEQARRVAQNAAFIGFNIMQGVNSINYQYAAPGTALPTTERLHQASYDKAFAFAPDKAPRIVAAALDKAIAMTVEASYLYARVSAESAAWQLGSSNSPSVAQRRATSATKLSRAAAAHALVGGAPGLVINGYRVDSFCTNELTPGGRRALEILRESGIDPADVANVPITTELLVDGLNVGTLEGSGSVRERLAILRNDPRLMSPPPVGTTVLALNSLRVEDFEEARVYLREEQHAFGRSRTAIASEQIRSGAFAYGRYLSTSTEPSPRADVFYSTIARGAVWPTGVTAVLYPTYGHNLGGRTGTDYPEAYDVARFIDLVSIKLDDVVAHSFSSASGDPLKQLKLVVEDLRRQNPVTTVIVRPASSTNLTRAIETYSTVELTNVRLIRGEDSLDCATSGLISGRRCTELVVPPAVPVAVAANMPADGAYVAANGFGFKYVGSIPDASVLEANTNYYIVGTIKADGELGPAGTTIPLGGLVMNEVRNSWSTGWSVRVPFVPEAEAKAAEYLRPSSKSCSRVNIECDGASFDSRLPLENELATNEDGVENSWKLYLDRAEQAANKADEFGEAYLRAIAAELQNTVTEERVAEDKARLVEEELEIINRTCGTSLDPAPLIAKLGITATQDFTNVATQPCTTDSNCNGKQCVAGTCVASPIDIIDDGIDSTGRLQECIGQENVTDVVMLGSRGVCLKVATDGTICDGKMDETCPKVDYSSTQCNGLADGPGYEWTYVSDHIGAFDPDLFRYKADYAPVRGQRVGNGPCWYNYPSEDRESSVYLTRTWDYIFHGEDFPRYPCGTGDTNARAVLETEWWTGNDAIRISAWPAAPETGAGGHLRTTYLVFKGCDAELNSSELQVMPPEAQYWLMQRYTKCLATNLEGRLALQTLRKVPRRIVEVLRDHGLDGAAPSLGGEYAEEVFTMRAAMVRYKNAANSFQENVLQMAEDLEQVRGSVDDIGIRTDQGQLAVESGELERAIHSIRGEQLAAKKDIAVVGAIGSYAGAIGSAASLNAAGAIGGLAAGAQAVGEIGVLEQEEAILELQKAITENRIEAAELDLARLIVEQAKVMSSARAQFRRRSEAMKGFADEARAGLEGFNASLASLETKRETARRAYRKAVRLMSRTSEASKDLKQFLSYDVALKRQAYEEARKGAVRLAFLAKRAIEQRIGMRLSSLRDDLPLVGAPAEWENDICVATGIDFEKLRAGDQTSSTAANVPYVWEYVDRLRRTVESYRLEYGFQDGQDTMVLSLKEDVFQSRQSCQMPHVNLLTWSEELVRTNQTDGTGWQVTGCTNCVSVAGTMPVPDPTATTPPLAMTVTFTAAGTVRQPVALQASNKYVLSQYGSAFALTDSTGAVLTPFLTVTGATYGTTGNTWQRTWRAYNIPADGTYYVALTASAASAVKVAGVMLESRPATDTQPTPLPYHARDASAMRTVASCPDMDGSEFRADNWVYDCTTLCANGLGGECDQTYASDRCYWETSFPMGQAIFELGSIKTTAGFATGNYNYRLDMVGVNFVGTTLRSCGPESGPACQSVGSLPFSLEHQGAFTVRNHLGEDFVASLFNGRIEHGRGLAIERYLTNPLSSADSGLLGPFLRKEFQGRPLDGYYVLRVWDEPGVEFHRIEDVQLYFTYRYWTRL